MSVRNALLALAVTVAGFIIGTVVVTEITASTIEFSLLLGLPAGVVGGLVVGILAYLWLGDSDAAPRRRGAALAAFSVVFLGGLISLVVVADFRNSQALPVSALVGVVAGVGTYLWFRRSNRNVRLIDSP